jgi:hypothetical protein
VLVPPVRGTSMTDEPSTPTTILTNDIVCPQAFYACSASYPGAGCCRIGRDCSTTNCPPLPASTTIVQIDGSRTIAVPLVPAATTLAVGTCATGWASCAASVGGNCCPSGWQCGTESCTSTGPTATTTVGKGQVLGGGADSLGKSQKQWYGLVVVVVVGLLI